MSKAEALEQGLGFYFDPKKAAHAVAFFENFLVHSKGRFAGKPFTLLDWQREEVIEEIFGWMRCDTDTRRYRVGYIEVPKKNGKALAVDTPIPTPAGWRAMGDIQVGDLVFGIDGKPVRVTAATEVMHNRPCFSLSFRNAESIVADSSHLWALRDGSVVTTEEAFRSFSSGNRVHVSACKPVSTATMSLPIDPYVLGLWLGDGHSASARITVGVGDEETIKNIVSCGYSVRVKKYASSSAYAVLVSPTPKSRGTCSFGHDLQTEGVRQKSGYVICRGCERERDHFRRNGTLRSKRTPICFQESLRKLGLLGSKYIPEMYLNSSIKQRTAVLSGLMDSDGFVSKAGGCQYVTKSDDLASGMRQILSSLGIVHSARKKPGKVNGKVVGHYWTILFTPPAGMKIFRLSRKQRRLEDSPRKSQPFHSLVSISPCKSVPVRCIQVDSEDGVFLAGRNFIPTHNSTLLSGIGLYMTVADGEASAECFGCANSREQAGIVYKQMKELVEASPALSRRLEVVDSRKTIACVPTNSFWRVISSDSGRQEGLNIHSLVYDEIHQAKDRRLWDAVRYGGISRSQSLILAITTAGAERNSICWELHETAIRVMEDPSYDPQFFGYVRAATPEDDYRSPAVWKAANPSYGVTMDEESFKADVRDAEQSNNRLASFLRYRLNIWVEGESKFINLTQWDKCKASSGHLGQERIWYAGLDLAQTWDCNAFVAVSRAPDDCYDVLCRFWIPADNAREREIKDNIAYSQWAKDQRTGLVLTPGDVCDYEFVKRDILQFCKERTVRKIAVDPHNSHYLVQQLQAEGLDVVGMSQTFASLNTPTKTLETLIAQGRLRTNDNAILNFMAANAVTKTNSDGYIKVVKPSPMSPKRVDGIIAMIMGINLASDAAASPAAKEPEILLL